jgi:hypothetical protein
MRDSMRKTVRLAPFEEAVGELRDLNDNDGVTNAMIGKLVLMLPLDMAEKLRPLLGSRIAILRTDIPGKQYLYRILGKVETSIASDGDMREQNETKSPDSKLPIPFCTMEDGSR